MLKIPTFGVMSPFTDFFKTLKPLYREEYPF